MKFAVFTAAIASAATFFTGAVAAPQPAGISVVERAASSSNSSGPVSVIDLANDVRTELNNANAKLHSSSSKRASQGGEVINSLSGFFGGWNQHLQQNNSVTFNGGSTPNIVTVVLDIVETLVSVVATLIKDAPSEVASLLKEIAALVFDIGNGLSKGIPELSWIITPIAHLAGAVLVAIANALAPSSSNKAALTPHAMLNTVSLNN